MTWRAIYGRPAPQATDWATQQALLPVLAMLLRVTPEEYRRLVAARQVRPGATCLFAHSAPGPHFRLGAHHTSVPVTLDCLCTAYPAIHFRSWA